jgi:hypothetical protein
MASFVALKGLVAVAYHWQMSNPRLNNWAELTFIWY